MVTMKEKPTPKIRITFRGQIIKYTGMAASGLITCFYDPSAKYQEAHFKAFYSKLIVG